MTYKITVPFEFDLATPDLVKALQSAYDTNGVAGGFDFITEGAQKKVVFKRYISEDLDYVVERVQKFYAHIDAAAAVTAAAKDQLVAELSDYDSSASVEAIIEALGSDAATVEAPALIKTVEAKIAELVKLDLRLVVDLDERGSFRAHVEDKSDKVVFEYSNEDEDGNQSEEGISLVTDGYMEHGRDTEGLLDYLQTVGIASNDATLRMDGSESAHAPSFR